MAKKKLATVATQAPHYKPGDHIASNEVCGVVETAFFRGGEWNYILVGNAAVDTDKPAPDPENPGHLRMGVRYIRESAVLWAEHRSKWNGVDDTKKR